MNRFRVFLFFLLGIGLTVSVCWAQGVEDNNCIVCHSDYWDAMQGSVHGQHQITCDRCHGGDPAKDDMDEVRKDADYVGVPNKIQIAKKCGGCHADVEAMNFYGIPTDQLARYQTSAHGKLLFQKYDQHAAVCSDCHGYHDVVSVKDPSSPVYPLNLPGTCNRCHGDSKIMSRYKHPTDIYEKYKNSVHGVALFQKHDLGTATCAKCHGSHGAMPPGVKDIGATCGKCHMNENKHFLESPHAAAAAEGVFPQCAACHDYHDIKKPSTALYNTACLNCHDQKDEAFQRGQKIKEMIESSSQALAVAEKTVRSAASDGLFVDAESAALEELKTNVIEMAPTQHALSLEKISKLRDNVVELDKKIRDGIQEKRRDLRRIKAALVPMWIFIFFMAVILYIRYKQLKGKKHE